MEPWQTLDIISLGEKPSSNEEEVVHEIILNAANCSNNTHFISELFNERLRLREALTALSNTERKLPFKQSPESRLKKALEEAGAQKKILDALAFSRLNCERADRTFFSLRRFGESPFNDIKKHPKYDEFCFSRWSYVFGLVFLAKLASGEINRNEPSIDFLLTWMRESSVSASIYAIALEEAILEKHHEEPS